MKDTLLLENEFTIHRIGLGTNRITENDRSKTALKKALELGINFIDTAAAYTGGQSEKTIGDNLAPYPENIVIATKGGMHAPDFHIDSSPRALKQQLENSLRHLKLNTIQLYFLHRVDPKIPLKDSILFLKQMQQEGMIKHIGLSEVTIEQIEEARKLVDIVAVENEYNLSERKYEDVIEYCEKEQIIFVPFFPLHFDISDLQTFLDLQKKYHATREQLALAWLLKRSPMILPIPGSLSTTHLQENIAATKIELSDDDSKKLSNTALQE